MNPLPRERGMVRGGAWRQIRFSPLSAQANHLSREVRMRRVGPNSFTEIYFAGCNPCYIETNDGYVMIDSPQQPIDAVRGREQLEEKAPIRYLINTEPHGDHISGNAYFPKVPVVGHVKLQECFRSEERRVGKECR